MNPNDIQKALEAIGKSGIKVAGDLVIEKHVQYEVENVEDGGIGIQINNQEPQNLSKTPKSDNSSSWEEAIPEYLRTGKWATAWQRLKEQGFVDENYHRTEKLKETRDAHYVASCFVRYDGSNEYAPFERLWGMKNLRQVKSRPTPELKNEIDKIFSELL